MQELADLVVTHLSGLVVWVVWVGWAWMGGGSAARHACIELNLNAAMTCAGLGGVCEALRISLYERSPS